MKSIHNKTQEPLRVSLGGGKVLHLGPGQTGQISDEAVDSPGVKKLIKKKAIVLEGGEGHPEPAGHDQGARREIAHGHQHGTNKVFPSGNRGG